MRASQLLSIIGRIDPRAWDAIIPHGPVIRGPGDLVALNPQPLPPRERLLVGAAVMAQDIGRIAVEQNVRGEKAAGFVSEFIDDWCGTPWPHKWPHPGPRRELDADDVAAARVVGAMVFADLGARLADEELANALIEGADRLAEVAVG